MKKIVIWGAGRDAKEVIDFCRTIGMDISACIDMDIEKQGKQIEGLEIISPEGLKNIESDFYTIIITSLVYQDTIIATIKELGIECNIVTRTQLMPYRSFAEYGEDVLAASILKRYGVNNVRYVEVGVPHGIFGSNTRYFYDLGMRGLCIEANPDCYDNLRENRGGTLFLTWELLERTLIGKSYRFIALKM